MFFLKKGSGRVFGWWVIREEASQMEPLSMHDCVHEDPRLFGFLVIPL